MTNHYDKYRVNVPEGISGDWRIEKFSITTLEAEHYNMVSRFSFSSGGNTVKAGDYTRLMRGRTIVMSDTESEILDHMEFIICARGEILIGGLGLGMVLNACLNKDEVEHVTVVEKSTDVIKLVSDHYFDKFGNVRLDIIHDDILTWKPSVGRRWDSAWWDIWDGVCADNVVEMTKIKRRFGRRVKAQGCWEEDRCRRANK